MKLRTASRMRAGFAAMSVLLLAGGLVTVLYTYRMQSVTSKLLANNVTGLKAAEALGLAVERMGGLTTADLLKVPQSRHSLEDREAEFRQLLRRAETTARAPMQSTVLQELAADFAAYENELKAGFDLGAGGQTAPASARLARASELVETMHTLCERFERANEGLMYTDLGEIEQSNRKLRIAMYGLGASGILLGYFLGLAISRSIMKPIYELVLKVRGAAGHELVELVDVPRGAELEDLDQHVRHLIDGINSTRADLEKSRRLLQRSEKLAALGRVSAGVAHEIRNPLTSIKMLIYSLGENATLDEDQKKDLSVIAKEIDRMDRFVDNFLKFARPPDPKLELVDPNQIVRETLDLLGPRLRQSNARLIENYDPELGTIRADPDQIRQVMMNLVLNALDAMPEGGSLTLDTRRAAPEENDGTGWVQVSVTDTGRGIPGELLETIFDPFVSGRDEGVGLGLAISYQIVQQHGGWMDALSANGGGTTILVSLPDHRGQEHAQSTGSGRRRERPLLVQKNPA